MFAVGAGSIPNRHNKKVNWDDYREISWMDFHSLFRRGEISVDCIQTNKEGYEWRCGTTNGGDKVNVIGVNLKVDLTYDL